MTCLLTSLMWCTYYTELAGIMLNMQSFGSYPGDQLAVTVVKTIMWWEFPLFQNWLTRWFVLYKNELSYYKTREVSEEGEREGGREGGSERGEGGREGGREWKRWGREGGSERGEGGREGGSERGEGGREGGREGVKEVREGGREQTDRQWRCLSGWFRVDDCA